MLAPLPPGRTEDERQERGEGERDDESGGHQGQRERRSWVCGASAGGERDPSTDQHAPDEDGELDPMSTPSFAPRDAFGDVGWDVGWDAVQSVVRIHTRHVH